MPEPKFVTVASKATGRKQAVPAHFLDNPILAAPFRELPSARAEGGYLPPPPPPPYDDAGDLVDVEDADDIETPVDTEVTDQ